MSGLVDYERAWLDFKRVIVAKPSHGKRDLLAEMARIEVESEVPEGQENYSDGPTRRAASTVRRSRPTHRAPNGVA